MNVNGYCLHGHLKPFKLLVSSVIFSHFNPRLGFPLYRTSISEAQIVDLQESLIRNDTKCAFISREFNITNWIFLVLCGHLCRRNKIFENIRRLFKNHLDGKRYTYMYTLPKRTLDLLRTESK